tara:strand:- start:5747 stop:6415 length:669 start_codon:yes stop_codon:yes gene_type:complete
MRNLLIILLLVIKASITAQTGMDILMFNEINNFRSDPKSYITLAIDYVITQKSRINRIKEGKTKVSSTSGTMTKSNGMVNTKTVRGIELININIKAAEELILILENSKPLNKLLYSKDMDSITNSHGRYLDSVKQIGHFGPNAESLSDRFPYKYYPYVSENICNSGFAIKVRNDFKPAILMLLIDSRIETRVHRKNLLSTKVTHISIYIGNRVCIQNFALLK